MKKILQVIFLVVMVACGLVFAQNLHFSLAQTGVHVSGIISIDTAWIKANSPYSLTGPVAINNGVTLTIEAGTAVDLGSYYIRVNGTLIVRGTSTDPVSISGGSLDPSNFPITFTPVSNSWNQTTGKGSIIENTILSFTKLVVDNVSPKISGNTLRSSSIQIYSGAPIISKNIVIHGSIATSGSSTITGNIMIDGSISTIYPEIEEGAPIVSNNTLDGRTSGLPSQYTITPGPYPTPIPILGQRSGIISTGYAIISDNSVSNFQSGILLHSITTMGGDDTSTALVERNLVTHNSRGIDVSIYSRGESGTNVPTILNNTISENTVGIYLSESSYTTAPTLKHNNIVGNSNYSMYIAGPDTHNNVDATNNYWGTTNTAAINQTIYDFKNDFNLGTVSFVPFLNEPNPEAMPNPNAPTSIPTSIPNPTVIVTSTTTSTPGQPPVPSQPELSPTLSASPSPLVTSTAITTNQPSSQPAPQPGNYEVISALMAVIAILAVTVAVLAIKLKNAKRDKQ